ncbi:MAG TPA: hypothetical protein VFF65_09710 [Phycisphaerales bacterium]|nr:hypothetical protein [Phycisphaerales bacterium]
MPTKPRKVRRIARTGKKPAFTAAGADRYTLYQLAVQEPDADLDFLDRVYRKRFGRLPSTLREDFAGTALTASRWVQRRGSNTAVAVDLDPVPLRWFAGHIEPGLSPDQRERLQVRRADVVSPENRRAGRGGGFDAVFAFNFSYWVFKRRDAMLTYFNSVRASLGEQGLFLLDHFGGSDTMVELVERTRKKGFVYVWDQHSFDPVSGDLTCFIGFEFKDGTSMPRAFRYDWRLWMLPELRDILNEAGFSTVEVYIERDDKDGNGTGVYTLHKRAKADRAVISYIVAAP